MYEKVFNHYHNRRKLEAPYTKQAVAKTRSNSCSRASLRWETLMFAEHPASFPAKQSVRRAQPRESEVKLVLC